MSSKVLVWISLIKFMQVGTSSAATSCNADDASCHANNGGPLSAFYMPLITALLAVVLLIVTAYCSRKSLPCNLYELKSRALLLVHDVSGCDVANTVVKLAATEQERDQLKIDLDALKSSSTSLNPKDSQDLADIKLKSALLAEQYQAEYDMFDRDRLEASLHLVAVTREKRAAKQQIVALQAELRALNKHHDREIRGLCDQLNATLEQNTVLGKRVAELEEKIHDVDMGEVERVEGDHKVDVERFEGDDKVHVESVEGDHKVDVERVEGDDKVHVESVEGDHKVHVESVEGDHKVDVERVEGDDKVDVESVEGKVKVDVERVEGEVKVDVERVEGEVKVDVERVEGDDKVHVERVGGDDKVDVKKMDDAGKDYDVDGVEGHLREVGALGREDAEKVVLCALDEFQLSLAHLERSIAVNSLLRDSPRSQSCSSCSSCTGSSFSECSECYPQPKDLSRTSSVQSVETTVVGVPSASTWNSHPEQRVDDVLHMASKGGGLFQRFMQILSSVRPTQITK